MTANDLNSTYAAREVPVTSRAFSFHFACSPVRRKSPLSVVDVFQRTTATLTVGAIVSRGHGRWQKVILGALEAHPVVDLSGGTRSETVAIQRAAKKLQATGLVSVQLVRDADCNGRVTTRLRGFRPGANPEDHGFAFGASLRAVAAVTAAVDGRPSSPEMIRRTLIVKKLRPDLFDLVRVGKMTVTEGYRIAKTSEDDRSTNVLYQS